MMMRAILAGFALSALLTLSSWPATRSYDVAGIIRHSVRANTEDWQAAPEYAYFERDRAADGQTRTYEELMVLGSPYERLVAVNGKLLSPEQQAQQQQKLEAARAERGQESPQQREQRVAKYEKERGRDQLLMEQMAIAFNFRLVGEQILAGRAVYVLRATPRPGYDPPNIEARVLTGMQGTLWIDQQTFQWVKVQVQVTSPVSIGGFLARVEPGTRFELEKMPVAPGIWLPQHFSMRSKARVLFLFTRSTQEDETYYGYYKAGPDQASVAMLPRPAARRGER